MKYKSDKQVKRTDSISQTYLHLASTDAEADEKLQQSFFSKIAMGSVASFTALAFVSLGSASWVDNALADDHDHDGDDDGDDGIGDQDILTATATATATATGTGSNTATATATATDTATDDTADTNSVTGTGTGTATNG